MSDVRHTFNNPQPDGSDNTVQRPSDWNAQHRIANGTAAAPGLGPTSQSDVGWFVPTSTTDTWALATGGVERLRVDDLGRTTFMEDPTDTLIGTDTWPDTRTLRVAAQAVDAGDATDGSANEWAMNIQMYVPSLASAASYEKAALFVLGTSADPTPGLAAGDRAIVGADIRGYSYVAPGQIGSAFGILATAFVPAGGYDAQLIGIEVDMYNNGVDQSLLMQDNSKYAIHLGNKGTVPGSAVLHIIKGGAGAGQTWHYGLVMHTDALNANTDKFLWLTDTSDGSTGIFEVDKLGNVSTKAGTTGMTSGFVYVPSAAGVPSGTPTTKTGRVAFYYDSTNNQIYVYNGAWKKTVALT